ncbi:MAG TPA: helix-turn-helix domain-containing protein [Rhizomicrobium sp.]|jgi:transcriptional regulator with XRE-family HTH domain|nr:helix-turn-helix domain-containing protein [Rhizomicrobium sp.]
MQRILKLLGRNVRARRLARGMVLDEVCAKAQVSLYLLKRIEAGKSNPAIGVVFRLSRALGTRPADLFTDVPPRGSRRRN